MYGTNRSSIDIPRRPVSTHASGFLLLGGARMMIGPQAGPTLKSGGKERSSQMERGGGGGGLQPEKQIATATGTASYDV